MAKSAPRDPNRSNPGADQRQHVAATLAAALIARDPAPPTVESVVQTFDEILATLATKRR